MGDLDVQIEFLGTLLRVLQNVYEKPGEKKFRSVKKTVPKLFGSGRPGLDILKVAGFSDLAEDTERIGLHSDVEVVSHGQLGPLIGAKNAIQKIANKVNEAKIRQDRDVKIKAALEEDKVRPAKYGGNSEGGRLNVGQD